jgi:hypothetical protein
MPREIVEVRITREPPYAVRASSGGALFFMRLRTEARG